MAASQTTRILFVPYRPRDGDGSMEGENEISQQKHAAREYHRKAKQRRLSAKRNLNATASETRNGKTAANTPLGTRSIDARPVLHPRARTTSVQPSLSRSSLSVLSSGKADPFDTYAVSNLSPYAHKMLDYCLVYQWPLYVYCNPDDSVEDMKRHVMTRAKHSPASFFSLLYAAASHHAIKFYEGRTVPRENIMLRLDYKTRLLEVMRQEIEAAGSQVPDELLYIMLSLAAFCSGETAPGPIPRHSDLILAKSYELELYARQPCQWAHLRALYHLLRQRGGLTSIRRVGFARAVSTYDILTSFQRLELPAFPLLNPTHELLKFWPPILNPRAAAISRSLGTGFQTISEKYAIAKLRPSLNSAAEIAIGFDRFQHHDASGPSLQQILTARTGLVHDLLCLHGDSSDPIYELIRLATSAFTLLGLYPLPRPYGPHEKLALQLMVALDNCTVLDMWSCYPGLLLWATVLGGMLANETPLRTLFVQQSGNSAIKNSICNWPMVKEILATFLWLDSECEAEGLAFWMEGCHAISLNSSRPEWSF